MYTEEEKNDAKKREKKGKIYFERLKEHKASCFAKTCSYAFNLIIVPKEEKFQTSYI